MISCNWLKLRVHVRVPAVVTDVLCSRALEIRMSYLVLKKMAEIFTHCEEEKLPEEKRLKTSKDSKNKTSRITTVPPNLKNIWWTKHHIKDLNLLSCICRGTDNWRWKLKRHCQGGVPTSRIGVYKCFISLWKIERKFFVFVGILEKGIEIRCEETITVLQFLS